MNKQKLGNRHIRTRKDILVAAAKLLKNGKNPTLEEVAREALVSRATAYRYFSNIEELLTEAPLDQAVADPNELFGAEDSLTVEDRVDKAETALHGIVYNNEAQLRVMLAQGILKARKDKETPVRQNRRSEYIEAALKPIKKKFDPKLYHRLHAALALVFGTESMIVFQDVLSLEPDQAREIKSWVIRALVGAALAESKLKQQSAN